MNIVVKAQNLHPQKHNIDVEISIPTTCPRCGVAYSANSASSDHRFR